MLNRLLFYLLNTEINLEYVIKKDNLTRLGKRDYLLKYLDRQWIQHRHRNKKHGTKLPLSMILWDIDGFRRFTSRYGYLYGDRILQNIGDVLNNFNRYPFNFIARVAGDEFLIVLPATSLDSAVKTAKEIQSSLKLHSISQVAVENENIINGYYQKNFARSLTLSYGVVSSIPNEQNNARSLIEKAEDCTMASKQIQGGDYITCRTI